MGDLIRNFSGPLTPPDSLDTSTPPPSAKYGRNFSDLSAFDNSVEDLMPIPAKRLVSGRVISDSESMPGKLLQDCCYVVCRVVANMTRI